LSERYLLDVAKKKTALLGLAFVVLLGLACAENMFFYSILSEVLRNLLLAVIMLFLHNVLVVSLMLLGMTFYVNLVVLNFFRKEKYSDIVISHPRAFALIFSILIVILSVVRGANMTYGSVNLGLLPLMLLISTPIGIVEGYGIYLTIKRTLSRTMSTRSLIMIYCVFLLASMMEVAFIYGLIMLTT